MKKWIYVISVCALFAGAAGCGKEQSSGVQRIIEQGDLQGGYYVYVGNEEQGGFAMIEIDTAEWTPEMLLSSLAEEEVMPQDVKVLSFEQDGDHLTLDLSKEYQEYVSSSGTAGERVAVGSMVNTFLDAYNAQTITVLVEGAALDIGHSDNSGPLSWY